MNRSTRPLLALALVGMLARAAGAHFNMLLPDKASVGKAPVTIVYQWGHPFEHQLFDAPAPQSVSVLAPDGKKTALAGMLKEIKVPGEDRKVRPIWMGEEEQFFQDAVKVVLHVQAQGGWDAAAGQDFELVPLTRPYGLEPGMVFQAQALAGGKPLAGALVEVERYNAAPPKELPPDEHITRTARTDPNGVVTCTLTDPGWWCVTAERDGGTRQHDGKAYPVRQRSTLWVFVDEKATPK
jgi:cobalt/nickel transport protein